MKMKPVVILLIPVVLLISCNGSYKHLQDNTGLYNTCISNSNELLERLRGIRIYPDSARAYARYVIDYVDDYTMRHGKDIPSSVKEVSDLDHAVLYYMSITRQMAVMTSGFAGKADVWTQEEAEELFYSKADSLVIAERKAINRWDSLQEEYARQHGIKLTGFVKAEKIW